MTTMQSIGLEPSANGVGRLVLHLANRSSRGGGDPSIMYPILGVLAVTQNSNKRVQKVPKNYLERSAICD
jgi:hypothetical protein